MEEWLGPLKEEEDDAREGQSLTGLAETGQQARSKHKKRSSCWWVEEREIFSRQYITEWIEKYWGEALEKVMEVITLAKGFFMVCFNNSETFNGF